MVHLTSPLWKQSRHPMLLLLSLHNPRPNLCHIHHHLSSILLQNGLFNPAVFKTRLRLTPPTSIIISSRARPPPDVVQQVLDLRTPPPSPSQPSSPSQSTTILPVVVEESHVTQETTVGTAEEEDDVSIPQPEPAEDVESSSSVTSSSVVAPLQTSTSLASTPTRSAISASNRQKVMDRPSTYPNSILFVIPSIPIFTKS
jgi:hypothetical protein